jgi:hypothetical protein
MGISITYFFGLRMGVGMGMVFIYNQLLIYANYNYKNCARDGGGARSIKKYLLIMIYYIVRLTICELKEGHCN